MRAGIKRPLTMMMRMREGSTFLLLRMRISRAMAMLVMGSE